MEKNNKIIMSAISIIALLASNAFAHFQMLYTPNTALKKGKTIQLREVFTHPFTGEHIMDMGKQHDTKKFSNVEDFFVVHKGKKKNLKASLKNITFKASKNGGHAYTSKYKAKRMGDYIFILRPAPYYEANEDIYIQQITKTIINVAGAPTDWDTQLNLKAEIVPLVKPYAIWEHGSFTGIVKSNGKVVPFAEIEVTYINRDIDIKNNKMESAKIEIPQDSFGPMGIKANKNGEFTFAIPKAGFWGFCALGVGSNKEYKGKELSQDAIIWIEAKPMK